MAAHGTRPTLDLTAGRETLERTLPRVLAARDVSAPEDLGWRREGARSLLVPMTGRRGGERDGYLLRLDFATGPEWPPSARFVNPDTLDYVVGADRRHAPQITSPEVHVHPEYGGPDGVIQLVCCSAVREYYDVLHGGEEHILWTERDDFLLTLSAIGRALGSHYQGRFPDHG
jgi:hypothetical protein